MIETQTIKMGTRPLLFLDVDGPLIPFGGGSHPTFPAPTGLSSTGLSSTGPSPAGLSSADHSSAHPSPAGPSSAGPSHAGASGGLARPVAGSSPSSSVVTADVAVAIPAQGGPRDPLPAASHPLLARIDPSHGPRLAALPCDLVWATTWAENANVMVAPRAGLPRLAVVVWPEPSPDEDQAIRNGLHWKTAALVTWAAGRPFAWVDDEITEADQAWVSGHHSHPALLHRVDPRHGLTDDDYATLATWLTAVAESDCGE